MISDGHEGIKAAVGKVLNASWQRCRVHFMRKRMIEDRGFDLGRDPVGMRPLRPGQPVDQPVGAVGLEVAADLVELLASSPSPDGPC